MKYWLHEIVQFIFFLIGMAALGVIFVLYAFYTLFYYMFTKWDENTR